MTVFGEKEATLAESVLLHAQAEAIKVGLPNLVLIYLSKHNTCSDKIITPSKFT